MPSGFWRSSLDTRPNAAASVGSTTSFDQLRPTDRVVRASLNVHSPERAGESAS